MGPRKRTTVGNATRPSVVSKHDHGATGSKLFRYVGMSIVIVRIIHFHDASSIHTFL